MHRKIIALAACVALLSGCGLGPASSDEGAGPPAHSVEAHEELPFSHAFGWLGDDGEAATSGDDAAELLSDCLQAQGFPEEAVPPLEDVEYNPLTDPSEPVAALLGLPSREAAEDTGYGIVDAIEEREETEPNDFDRWVANISEDEAAAFGRALEDCQGELTSEDDYAADDLTQLISRYRNDQRVENIYDEWATCMEERGFADFEDPADARTSITVAYWEPLPDGELVEVGGPDDPMTDEHRSEVREEEISTALADLECQEETVLPHLEELAAIQEELLDEYADRVGE